MPTQIQGIEFEVVGSGAEEAAKSLDDLAASLKKIKSAASSGLGTSKATKDISALSVMLNDAKKALTSVGQGALKAGKSILAMPFKSVADRVKSLNGRFSTLLSSLKRIAFYRIISTVIKEVGQALKEGIKNLYGWSTLVNGQFKTSMDTISTSMLYLKNSIGAAVAPIINALAPAIDFLIDKVVALINVINQLFAVEQSDDRIRRLLHSFYYFGIKYKFSFFICLGIKSCKFYHFYIPLILEAFFFP